MLRLAVVMLQRRFCGVSVRWLGVFHRLPFGDSSAVAKWG
ncbi:hypothetical protein SynA1840_01475 [Synechococcus sp. A18-40]|nr:hypothetical protein SynA1840_01475 [Synechococcus sp. A18-40]